MAKVAFIQSFWLEKLGIMHISSMLKRHGHQTCMAIYDKKDIRKKLLAFKPDIVGFQCTTGMQGWVYEMARFVKEEIDKKILVLVGGAHPTYFPEMIDREHIDLICRGEGEYPTLELVRRLDAKRDFTDIENLWVKREGKIYQNPMRPLIEDLDGLPFPDRELYEDYKFIHAAPYKHSITSRGCAYNCTFCYNHTYRNMHKAGGKYVRRRSIDNIIEDLQEQKRKSNLETVLFLDDNFNLVSRDWFFSFLDRYKRKIDLPFFCSVRADSLDDEMVKRIKEAGCYWIEMGLEAGNERYRNEVLKKNLKDEDLLRAGSLLRRYKISFDTTNMIGLPNETVEDAIYGLKLNARIKPDVAWYSIFQPYPKTELGEYCLSEGLVERLDRDSVKAQFHTTSPLNQSNIKELENLHKFAHVAAKMPFLLPLIRLLIKLPPNPLFLYFQRFTYLIFYHTKYNRINLRRTVEETLVALKYYRDKG